MLVAALVVVVFAAGFVAGFAAPTVEVEVEWDDETEPDDDEMLPVSIAQPIATDDHDDDPSTWVGFRPPRR